MLGQVTWKNIHKTGTMYFTMESKPTSTTSELILVYKCLKISVKTANFFTDRMSYLSFWESGAILLL